MDSTINDKQPLSEAVIKRMALPQDLALRINVLPRPRTAHSAWWQQQFSTRGVDEKDMFADRESQRITRIA